MFARLYHSRISQAAESVAGSSMMIGIFVWMNLSAAIIFILLLFDVRIRGVISPWSFMISYIISAACVWLFYKFRHIKVLKEYSQTGKSAARTSLIWVYIILSIVIAARSALAAHKHDDEMFDKERIVAPAEINAINLRRSTGRNTHGYFFRYEFTVDGKKYSGLIDQSKIKEKVIPGDSVAIFYAKSDPEISALALDDNGYMIIKRKYN